MASTCTNLIIWSTLMQICHIKNSYWNLKFYSSKINEGFPNGFFFKLADDSHLNSCGSWNLLRLKYLRMCGRKTCMCIFWTLGLHMADDSHLDSCGSWNLLRLKHWRMSGRNTCKILYPF